MVFANSSRRTTAGGNSNHNSGINTSSRCATYGNGKVYGGDTTGNGDNTQLLLRHGFGFARS
jgi:hypothetical protein